MHLSRRTRLFLIASAAVLVLGLGTGLLASYVGFQNLLIIGSDGPDELAYLPEDAGFVAFADVRDVMDSELRRKLLEMHPGTRDGHREEFEEKTGIDVERDVDRVVASLAADAPEQDRVLVLARGRFDEVRIEGLVREHGGQAEDHAGTRVLTLDRRERALGLAFVEPGLVAFGSPAAVRRAIDARSAGRSVRGNEELMRLVRDVSDGNAWAVGRFDAVAGGTRLPQAVASQLPPVTWFAARGRINGGVQGLVRAEVQSEQAANDLREVVRGFVALARLQARQHADLTPVMDSIELGGEGKTVSLSFTVSPEVIDTLALMQRRRLEAPVPPAAPTV